LSDVFLDASALVPIVVVRDQWHERVDAIMATLSRDRALRFRTSNWTLYEALAVAERRSRGAAAQLFSFAGRDVQVDRVEEDIELEALARFLNWTDKSASVVDHANVLLAVAAGCDSVISFDVDFIPIVAGTALRLLR
jgi:predicted nucleic acid-binding protein